MAGKIGYNTLLASWHVQHGGGPNGDPVPPNRGPNTPKGGGSFYPQKGCPGPGFGRPKAY